METNLSSSDSFYRSLFGIGVLNQTFDLNQTCVSFNVIRVQNRTELYIPVDIHCCTLCLPYHMIKLEN